MWWDLLFGQKRALNKILYLYFLFSKFLQWNCLKSCFHLLFEKCYFTFLEIISPNKYFQIYYFPLILKTIYIFKLKLSSLLVLNIVWFVNILIGVIYTGVIYKYTSSISLMLISFTGIRDDESALKNDEETSWIPKVTLCVQVITGVKIEISYWNLVHVVLHPIVQ